MDKIRKPFSIRFLALFISTAVVSVVPENDYILDSLRACKDPLNGKDGLCINFENDIIRCPSLRKILLDKNFTDIYSATCGEPDVEKLNETQVCCPVEEYIELYSKLEGSFETHKNFKLIPSPEGSRCGEAFGSFGDRIIGGTAAPPGTQPWMARLGLEIPDDGARLRYLCSGSILNERYVLTAAHCLKHGILRKVRLAEYDEELAEECIETVSGNICQKVEDYEIEHVKTHENYTGKTGSINDIALLRLKEPIRNLSSSITISGIETVRNLLRGMRLAKIDEKKVLPAWAFSESMTVITGSWKPTSASRSYITNYMHIFHVFTRPICLPFINEFELPDVENDAVTATGSKNALSVQGWGKENNDDQDGTKQLKQVNVPLRSNVYCRQFFRKANLTVTDQQICVGGAKDKGSCAGDSGSPLTKAVLNKKSGMRMFQIGIVSYGRQECGLENSPVIYTRVRSFLKWILDNIHD